MNPEPETASLVIAARSGHTKAFAHLVRNHQSELRNFLRRLTREDWQLADELAQDAFLQAHRSLARLDRPEKFRSWLFSIAYRKFIDHSRSRRARDIEVPTGDIEAEGPTGPDAGADYETMLALLAPAESALVDLVYRKGFSHSEAAETLRIPLGTVKTRVRAALQTLQKRLKERL